MERLRDEIKELVVNDPVYTNNTVGIRDTLLQKILYGILNKVEVLERIFKDHTESKDITEDKPTITEETTYRYGQTFRFNNTVSMLCQVVYDKITLIVMEGNKGNRWENPVRVKDPYKVTQEEMNKITDNEPYELIE